MQDIAELLWPKELGYGIPQGSKAAVYATRIYLYWQQPQGIILNLDYRNVCVFSTDHLKLGVIENYTKHLTQLLDYLKVARNLTAPSSW